MFVLGGGQVAGRKANFTKARSTLFLQIEMSKIGQVQTILLYCMTI